MTVRSVLAPLVRGATYRRGLFLLLGGVLALPYALMAAAFVQMWTAPDIDRVLAVVLIVVTSSVAVVPAFLPATRTVEIVAVRGLLDTDIPQPGHGPIDRESRLRSALWFALHLSIGGLVSLAFVVTVPMALAFVMQQMGIGTEQLLELGPLDSSDTGWWMVAWLGVLVGFGLAASGLGALAATVAPTLLGPSPDERIAALEAQASELAERNRLARELHDSVGHALTITTVQAAAARQTLDTDPEFARRAMLAVEEAGRAAMEDLDHVLGLLRERNSGQTAPQRTLADLDGLLADTSAAGADVEVRVDGDVQSLPAPVSREGYRIVQEALTNVVRHVGKTRAVMNVTVADDTLSLEITNPMAEPARASRRGGRGLDGMRERVTFLGGRMSAGPERGGWRVMVELPAGRGDSG